MDIVRIRCGLGNQMLGYALYCELKKRGRKVGLDLSFFKKYPDFVNPYRLESVFDRIKIEPIQDNIFDEECRKYLELKKDSKKMAYLEKHPEERKFWGEDYKYFGCYDERVFQTKDCIFVGTWQSEKYFQNSKDEVRDAFQFGLGEERLQKLGNEIKSENTVSIQFRVANKYYAVKTVNGFLPFDIIHAGYYDKAIEEMKNRIGGSIKFVVFSDDIEYVKDKWNLDEAIYISKDMFEHYEDWYDMYLMSLCKNNIIANSSFGWWGAWLNSNMDKIVIAPDIYCVGSPNRDVYPESWIRI